MRTLTRLTLVILALTLAHPAQAQFRRAPPPPPAPVEPLTPPPPDPYEWWANEREKYDPNVDPLFDRRAGRDDPRPSLEGAPSPLLYRLWGLPPLQTLILRENEVVLEVWVRPSRTTREAISRITVRRDGAVFVNARAGLACCRPEIYRRVDVDQRSETWDASVFRRLAEDPVWREPKEVLVERNGEIAALCGAGTAYDVVLLERDRFRHLRRICHEEAVGSIAHLLQPLLAPALGYDLRFDVVFPEGVTFAEEKAAYDALLASGGKLLPKTFNS